MQVLQRCPVLDEPNPTSSAEEWQGVLGLSVVQLEVEELKLKLNLSHRSLHHVDMVAYEEPTDSH